MTGIKVSFTEDKTVGRVITEHMMLFESKTQQNIILCVVRWTGPELFPDVGN